MAQIGKDIQTAKNWLIKDELVGIPTETVYGLAGNALSEKAILKIFEVKNRPFFDPLIVHVASKDQVENYAVLENSLLKKLADEFWPGPLTLILPKKACVPDLVTSGLPHVAIRVPNNELTLGLLNELDFPLAAPSANPFGYVSPTSATHVNNQLGNKINYILDGGDCQVGLESTIVGLEDNHLCIYRLGGLSIEKIERCVGKVKLHLNLSSNPKAPGQLKNHYAPRVPLYIGNLTDLAKMHSQKKVAAIVFGNIPNPLSSLTYFNLSEKSDSIEAAINLFAILRKIDESDFEVIITELLPEEYLGRAINDRLKRAESIH